MQQLTTIGVDLAKNVFQVHGLDRDGEVAIRLKLRRSQVLVFFSRLEPCLIGMEACSGVHHWARVLTALGHGVRLMPASCVKPCVKRGKTGDAEAICEAAMRPTMRFVPVKSAERQAALLDHPADARAANATPTHLAEFRDGKASTMPTGSSRRRKTYPRLPVPF